MPWPASRIVRPFCVSGGIRSDTRPFSVGTVTSPPSNASCIATGRSTRRSSPSRVKNGCGFTRTRRYASPGSPPFTPGLRAVLARDLDHVLGALVRLGQGDLDLALDVFALSCARACSRPRPAEKVVRLGKPAVPGLAEERSEEIREPAGVVAKGTLSGLARVHVLEPAGPRGASA